MLSLENISKAFDSTQVLKDLTLRVGAEEIVCLLGPSGCGKTTTLNILAGLIAPDSGQVRRPPGRIGYVFQEPRLLPWRTAAQNLALGLQASGLSAGERKCIADAYLEGLGLARVAGLYPHQLSGGMRQRVALGRALAIDPAFLLLDEPFRSLDVALRHQLIAWLLQEWQRRPRPVLFVTHDPTEAVLAGQRILVLGANPMHVREEITLQSTPGTRHLHDAEMLQASARLYQLLVLYADANGQDLPTARQPHLPGPL